MDFELKVMPYKSCQDVFPPSLVRIPNVCTCEGEIGARVHLKSKSRTVCSIGRMPLSS